MNMFRKNYLQISKGMLHIDETLLDSMISLWLPCPLAIWVFALGGNLFQSCYLFFNRLLSVMLALHRVTAE